MQTLCKTRHRHQQAALSLFFCVAVLLSFCIDAAANEPPSEAFLSRIRALYSTPHPFSLSVESPATFAGPIPDEIAPTIKSMEDTLLRIDEHGRKAYVLSRRLLSFDGKATTREERLNLLAGGPADRRTDVELLSPNLRASAPLAPTRRATVALFPSQTAAEQAATRKLDREPQARAIARRSPVHLALYIRDVLLTASDLVQTDNAPSHPTGESREPSSTISSASLGVEITVDNATGNLSSAFFEDGTDSLLIVPNGLVAGVTFPAPHPARWRLWSGPRARGRALNEEPFDAEITFALVQPKATTRDSAPFDWRSLAATALVTDGPAEAVLWRSGDPWPVVQTAPPR